MKAYTYKVVVVGNNIYKERRLSTEQKNLKIGTTKACHMRLNQEMFFESFELELTYTSNGWEIVCSDDIYFTTDGVMKISSKHLVHGDEIIVKYQKVQGEALRIHFLIDFDAVEKNYERMISLEEGRQVSIGGMENCNVFIKDALLAKDSILLTCEGGRYYVHDQQTKYGIYINGIKIKDRAEVEDGDFFAVVGYSFYLQKGRLYTSKTDEVVVNGCEYVDLSEQQSAFVYPKFNLNTRIKYKIPDDEVNILLPQALADPPKQNLLLSIIPVLVMMVLVVVLRTMMGRGGLFIVYSVATMTVGMFVTIANTIHAKREYKKSVALREAQYKAYIQKKEKLIQRTRQKELDVLEQIYRPIEENIDIAKNFKKELFEKEPVDEDYLHIRLGRGSREAECKVEYNQQDFIDTRDPLVNIPEELEVKYRFIQNAPIISDLLKSDAVGVVGPKKQLYVLLKNMTLDITTRHFFKQVKTFYMFDEKDERQFSWLRWFRHTENDALDIRNLIYDEESKNVLFEYLYLELSRREAGKAEGGTANSVGVHYIIFVFDDKGIKQHPISRYIKHAKNYGFTFIFFEESEDLLPQGCTEVIRLSEFENRGDLVYSENGKNVNRFFFEPISDEVAEEVAVKLASVYVDEVSLESQLTKNISLFELLDIYSVNDLDLGKRWATSEVYKTMAAPLGVKTKNEIVPLDLHEKYQGPHGLVAGTTGSGKSEILQSYILSMATLYHPYDVGFVIIDFKGGGMVNQFKNLPHLIGAITNIDGREVNRSLLSIKAELRKRQEYFAKYNVNHIDHYIKLVKKDDTMIPIPHLILVVDEFAELKSEHPEFMKELVSAARIGRSLGVHLILATQKPSGVVSDQIWSNSKFKLCLKVQTKQDSNEVIKTPLAAEIKEPGRAYLQVGNNELFELFQSAYSGAPAEVDDMSQQREYMISEVMLSGKRKPVFVKKKSKREKESATQLEAIVDYVHDFCEKKGVEQLPGICLPSLADLLNYDDAKEIKKNKEQVEVALGLYDDPAHQLQDSLKLNVTEAHTFIVGSSQYGKTNILQTVVRGLAEQYSPKEINIYILDFASMILKNFESLNHVGGVVIASEDERMKHFMKMMNSEVIKRKEELSKLGISSFASYKDAGYEELAQIVIMIDSFTAFRELFNDYDDDMLALCREGIAVGISIIATNMQTTGIGYKHMANFANRIALTCSDKGEYSSLFDRCRMEPKNIPGRGLTVIDKVIYEFQTYLGFDGEKEIDRVKKMREFNDEANSYYPGLKAKGIPEVPRILTQETLEEHFDLSKLKSYEVAVGVDYNAVALTTIDLSKIGYFGITGKEQSGKTNMLRIIFNHLYQNMFKQPVKVYILDDMNRQLKEFDEYGFVEKYSLDANDYGEILDEIDEELNERYEDFMDDGYEGIVDKPLLLVVVQNQEVLSLLGSDKAAMATYNNMLKKFKALKICFVYSNVENTQVGFNSGEIMKQIKESKRVMLFDNIANMKMSDISLTVARKYKKSIELGDAYYIRGGEINKIKTINQTDVV